MATIVKGDLYEAIDGKLHEIKRQLRQKEGYPYDPVRLDSVLQAIVEGRFETVGGQLVNSNIKPSRQPHPSDSIAASYIFTVVDGEDVEPSQFQIKDLELVSFLKPEDGGRVNVKTLRERAVTLKANLGLVDAKRLFDNRAEISPEFRGSVLVFTGTLLRDSDGYLRLASLYWLSDRWCLHFFRWIDYDFGVNGRLVRCKS